MSGTPIVLMPEQVGAIAELIKDKVALSEKVAALTAENAKLAVNLSQASFDSMHDLTVQHEHVAILTAERDKLRADKVWLRESCGEAEAENARLRADLARVESESAREITRLGVELSEAKHVASGLTADLAHLTVDAAENPPVPDETPGVRDAEFPCEDYAPVTDAPMPWANCESDGHHLCKGCRWYAPRLDPGSDKYEEPTS